MEFGRVYYYRKDVAARQAQIYRSFKYSPTEAAQRRAAKRLGQLAAGEGIGNNRPGSKRKKGSMVALMHRYKVAKGQAAKPYLGIVHGNAAIGAVGDDVSKLLTQAIRDEWDRITGQTYGAPG